MSYSNCQLDETGSRRGGDCLEVCDASSWWLLRDVTVLAILPGFSRILIVLGLFLCGDSRNALDGVATFVAFPMVPSFSKLSGLSNRIKDKRDSLFVRWTSVKIFLFIVRVGLRVQVHWIHEYQRTVRRGRDLFFFLEIKLS